MNAPPHAVYGGTILAEMQVEGQPTIYWKGLPITFTTCDYDSDEIMMLLKQKFCMGMALNVLLWTDGVQSLAGRRWGPRQASCEQRYTLPPTLPWSSHVHAIEHQMSVQ